MKKYVTYLTLLTTLMLLASCSSSAKPEVETNSSIDRTIVYTLEYDQERYQFNMLDGWRKFPNADESIAFLVGNDKKKTFMSAGFESKANETLDEYLAEYEIRLEETGATLNGRPESQSLNGLRSFYLSSQVPNGDKTLTYRIYLIEADNYFINLGAWTSQDNPTQETLDELDAILQTFKMQ